MCQCATDREPADESEVLQVLENSTPWAYRRAPLTYAVCEIYERCCCGNVGGDPLAWITAFHDRAILFDDAGDILGTFPTIPEAVAAYAKKQDCMARELRLDYDPAHRDPDKGVPRFRLP